MIAFEWFFVGGLAIGVIASRLFVPHQQHDARGVVLLICLAIALGGGWLLLSAGVPVAIALPTTLVATGFVARAGVRRTRRRGPTSLRSMAHNPGPRGRVHNS